MVSSAKWTRLRIKEEFSISFMYKEKRVCPKIEPCGTPTDIYLNEDVTLFTEMPRDLPPRHDLNLPRRLPLILILSQFTYHYLVVNAIKRLRKVEKNSNHIGFDMQRIITVI